MWCWEQTYGSLYKPHFYLLLLYAKSYKNIAQFIIQKISAPSLMDVGKQVTGLFRNFKKGGSRIWKWKWFPNFWILPIKDVPLCLLYVLLKFSPNSSGLRMYLIRHIKQIFWKNFRNLQNFKIIGIMQ